MIDSWLDTGQIDYRNDRLTGSGSYRQMDCESYGQNKIFVENSSVVDPAKSRYFGRILVLAMEL